MCFSKHCFLSAILLILLFPGCKENEKTIKEEPHEKNDHSVQETPQNSAVIERLEDRNCFLMEDKKRIVTIAENLMTDCKKNNPIDLDLLTKSFVVNYGGFPCDLYTETRTFKAIPEFIIDTEGENCNLLLVIFNYSYKIKDDGEVYSSEKSFMLYSIKTSEGLIQLDSFGTAG